MAAIPAIRTTTVLSPTLRSAPTVRAAPQVNLSAALLAFTALTYIFYSAASLAGSVLAEQARRDGLAAAARAKAATHEMNFLERRLDALRSMGAIEQWAIQNGFVAPDRAPHSSLVASRDH